MGVCVLGGVVGGLLSVLIAASLTLTVLSRVVQHLVSLSAGVLLGTALLHVLPEAFESHVDPHRLFLTLLGGLMFWILGLPAPLLWGVVMAILSMVPTSGTFLIWLPAAAVLASQGQVGKAAILGVWGMLVVSSVDNLVYPVLVGQRMRMP